jgi:hypothetical protein
MPQVRLVILEVSKEEPGLHGEKKEKKRGGVVDFLGKQA